MTGGPQTHPAALGVRVQDEAHSQVAFPSKKVFVYFMVRTFEIK